MTDPNSILSSDCTHARLQVANRKRALQFASDLLADHHAEVSAHLLFDALIPVCQYYAYVEIVGEEDEKLLSDREEGADLWQNLREVDQAFPQFEMRRVAEPGHIYPIFRDLFAANKKERAS